MTKTHTYRGVVWLDLESPTDDEVAGLVKRYDLHPLVGEELKTSSTLAKADFYKDYILVVLTLPVRVNNGTGYEIVDREIDFVIGKNFLITVRTETIEQLEYFGKIFEANAILNKDEKIEHAGYIFYYIVKRIYAGMIEDLENIKDTLTKAEKQIFAGHERNMVEVLSNISRELIDINQTARMHKDIWNDMVASGQRDFFGSDFSSYIGDIGDEFNIINELIINNKELVNDLKETNDSLLNSKQNDIIKLLTVLTIVLYPGTFLASIFTIPASKVPLVDSALGWWLLMAITVIISAGIIVYFKKKRWI